MPGLTNVVDLAGADEVIEGTKRLFKRGARVPRVALEQVNVLDAEALKGLLDAADEVVAREADVVRSRAGCR